MRECWPSTTRFRASSRGRSEGKEKRSGRATMTSRTVLLSSSMALWIISSWDSGIWPNWRLAVTKSLSSSGGLKGPPRGALPAPQNQASRPAHKKQHGAGEGEECFHRGGHREGNLFGTLQGQSFRHEFAQQDVQ